MLATAMPAIASRSRRPSWSQTWIPSARWRTGYDRPGSSVNSEPASAPVTRAMIAPGRSGTQRQPVEPALLAKAEAGIHRAAHDRRGQAGLCEPLALGEAERRRGDRRAEPESSRLRDGADVRDECVTVEREQGAGGGRSAMPPRQHVRPGWRLAGS